MKLDSIIYDKDSLSNAIVQQWLTDSEAFTAMYPSDTTTSLANVFASYGAMLQYCLVSAMANCYTETAFSDRGIYQLAVTLGNIIHGNSSAQVLVNLHKKNLLGVSTVIPKGTRFKINGKSFFNLKGIQFPAGVEDVKDIALMQGEYLEVVKTTSGVPYERFYFSSDFKCDHNHVEVTVNDEDWSVSDSFLEYDKSYISVDKSLNVVVLKTDSDGRSYIKFGDNQLGNLPSSGSIVKIRYVSNEGSEGNIGEINVKGTLDSSLIFLNANNIKEVLDIDIKTSTTSFGGFNTQSIDNLRHTSPYIFASGHRAVRRQDYEALLQSQCGYLTSAAWGEYEEANKSGTYDALMMNMVYYTGLKSFIDYAQSKIGEISNKSKFVGSVSSTKGFLGSHTVKISNNKNEFDFISLQDTGAKGQLFINNNDIDERDSVLPILLLMQEKIDDEYKFVNIVHEYKLKNIVNAGDSYAINDRVNVGNTGLVLKVTEVSAEGSVVAGILQYEYSLESTLANIDNYECTNVNESQHGNGLRVSLQYAGYYSTDFLTSSNVDHGDGDGERPIINAISNKSIELFYESNSVPTLEHPVQIRLDYSNLYEDKGVAAIKFRATRYERFPFIGKFAMYGTTIADATYDNVKNSKSWTRIIDVTELPNPFVENELDWTDWIPTNCSKGKDSFNRYKKFVIEIYSSSDSQSIAPRGISFNKIKILHEKEASFIYYDDNGDLDIKLPTVGDPGGTRGTLVKDLISNEKYRLYDYNVVVENVNKDNGYYTGNVLAYTMDNGDQFLVNVLDIESQSFRTTLNGSTVLSGNYQISENNKKFENVYSYEFSTLPYVGNYVYMYEIFYELPTKRTMYTNDSEIVVGTMFYIGDVPSGKVSAIRDGYYVIQLLREDKLVRAREVSGASKITLEVYADIAYVLEEASVNSNVYNTTDSSSNIIGKITKVNTDSFSVNVLGIDGDIIYLRTPLGYLDSKVVINLSGNGGYKIGDEIIVDGSNDQLKLRVESVTNDGRVKNLSWIEGYSTMVIKSGDPLSELNSTVNVTARNEGRSATGLKVLLKYRLLNGKDGVSGEKGTIKITSKANLNVSVGFKGNKIDNNEVTHIDYPIIEKYNHFTTYLEFKQPEVYPLDVIIKVSLASNAYVTSASIKQDIINNIAELFELKADSMGKGVKISDIYTAVMKTKNVNWCKVLKPTDNLIINKNNFLLLSSLTIREVGVDEE